MSEPYNSAVAAHYAAYRPPLHQVILRRALGTVGQFADGLDVGCGTGRSSVALVEYCRWVSAVDPSQAMLDLATKHPSITYLHGSGENVPLPDRSVEVVTFAGSLFYVDYEATLVELRRVCRPSALIVSYDFEVVLDDVLQYLDYAPVFSQNSYDHRVNLTGAAGFDEVLVEQDRIDLDIGAIELAHLVLSDAARHHAMETRYSTTAPFERLVADLQSNDSLFGSAERPVHANIYYGMYKFYGMYKLADEA